MHIIHSHPEDYRPYTFHSLAHVLHPNSAAYLSRTRILVTLFHKHALGVIDRTTNELTLLPCHSLSYPHAIRPVKNAPPDSNIAFSLCNTRGNKLVLLDSEAVEVSRVTVSNCNWIQVCGDCVVSVC